MKKTAVFLAALLALNAAALFADGPVVSGVLDTTVNYSAGTGAAPAHFWGVEEFANLRLRVNTGESAALYAAFNLAALSGSYAVPAPGGAAVLGENYAAALELERLYFRVNSDYFDAEAGLLRIPFGYGQVWGSSDFLNPRNPLLPNARTRGVLGTNFLFYPGDDLKLTAFAAAPKNPLDAEGGGFIPGLSLDNHWERASVQALYAFRTPLSDTPSGLHRFGFSLKADIALGFVADALYTLNPGDIDGVEGLSAGAGFDYNFFDGDLYVLAEYLFNGSSSATAFDEAENPLGRANRHYLYGSALYRFNDFTSLTLSTVFCFDDLSFQPVAAFDYEIFQGFALNLTARLPLDQKTLSGGRAGELGPLPPASDGSPGEAGARVIINAGARLRF